MPRFGSSWALPPVPPKWAAFISSQIPPAETAAYEARLAEAMQDARASYFDLFYDAEDGEIGLLTAARPIEDRPPLDVLLDLLFEEGARIAILEAEREQAREARRLERQSAGTLGPTPG